MKARKYTLGKAIMFGLMFILSVALMLPIVFTFFYSFFPKSEMSSYLGAMNNYSDEVLLPMLISPKLATVRQYYTILIEEPTYLYQFVNSAIYTVGILLGQMVIIPMMAFALSCFKFKGRELLFFLILVLMLMPFQVTMTPTVITLSKLGLMNTRWAVILPMWCAPFYIFLVRQYMLSVPLELLEAGSIDGAGALRTYIHIMIPVIRPIIGAFIALSFADNWNMVEQPLVYLTDAQLQPLSVAFNQISQYKEGQEIAFAGAALFMLPALIVYMFFQEDILLGVQMSELK